MVNGVIINAHSRFAALLKALDLAYSVSGDIIFMATEFMTVTSGPFVINYGVPEHHSLTIYITVL